MFRTPRLLPALSLALVTLAAVLGGACDEQAPARSPAFRDAPALVDEIERCIPSCAVDDSRVLAISTTGTGTIADIDMSFLVIADGDVRDLEVFIFDGDTADTDADGLHHWDLGSPQLAPQLMKSGMPSSAWLALGRAASSALRMASYLARSTRSVRPGVLMLLISILSSATPMRQSASTRIRRKMLGDCVLHYEARGATVLVSAHAS